MSENTRNPKAPIDRDEWMSPGDLCEWARRVLGEIDFDPCSTEIANRQVLAHRYFTKEQDALVMAWPHDQRIYMNPPFSRGKMDAFVDKLLLMVRRQVVRAAFVVTNNATETKWAHKLFEASTAVCFPEGRIGFLGPDGSNVNNNNRGQAIWYFGPNKRHFRQVSEQHGVVVERISNDRVGF